MASQLDTHHEGHWFSLITASPNAEIPECAIVAIAFGNGKLIAFRHQRDLPRLAGIAPLDTRRSFAAALEAIESVVTDGKADLDWIRRALGPQFTVQAPHALVRDLSDETIQMLTSSLLCAPAIAAGDPVEAVVRLSQRRLLDQLSKTSIQQSMIARRSHARELYPSLSRDIADHTPKVQIALRGNSGRDSLIDGVAFSQDFDPSQVREYIGRIGQAFYEFRTHLRPLLESREGRKLQLVSVVQPIEGRHTPDLVQLRGYALETLNHSSDVLVDAAREDPIAALESQARWVSGA